MHKPLKTVFHQATRHGAEIVEAELQARRNNVATLTYRYDIEGEQLFVVMHAELQRIIEQIWRTQRSIDAMWANLPHAAQEHYLHELLVEEIQSTNELENIHSTRQEISQALLVSGRSGSKRFADLAGTFRLFFHSGADLRGPRTVAEVRRLYDDLLHEEIAAEDRLEGGLFRSGPVGIWDGQAHQPVHRGVDPGEIIPRMNVMLDISDPSLSHGLIHAMVAHFMFEHIHPFYDGNGRFGRFLLALHLRELVSTPTALTLTAEIMRNKGRYYRAFVDLEDPMNKAEATFFVTDLMTMLCEAQGRLEVSLRSRLRSIVALADTIDDIRSRDDLDMSKRHVDILVLLGQVALFGPRTGASLSDVTSFLGLGRHTVRRALAELVQRGVVEEISRKPLVFALTGEGEALLNLPHG